MISRNSIWLIPLLAWFCSSTSADITLIKSLYEEESWQQCRVEAMRLLETQPDCPEARWFMTRAEQNLGMDVLANFAALGNDSKAPASVRLNARYEEALLLWRAGERTEAAEALREVFLHSEDDDLFLVAGATLSLVLREHPMSWGTGDGIGPQLRTSALSWNKETRAKARENLFAKKTEKKRSGVLFIDFYRSQIRPAIGNRCSLDPSCSEYSRQAMKKHGLLRGIPIMADRFIREPGVVSSAEKPVIKQGRIFFADPLCDHDWWFSRGDNEQAK